MGAFKDLLIKHQEGDKQATRKIAEFYLTNNEKEKASQYFAQAGDLKKARELRSFGLFTIEEDNDSTNQGDMSRDTDND